MIQILTVWLFSGVIGGREVSTGNFSVTRSTLPALKATIYKEFINYLFELGIYQYITHVKTTLEISFQSRNISFFSLDDSHKLRGRQHTFMWFNEVTDIDSETFYQGVMRTTENIYLDYNPSGEPFVKTEIEEDRLINRKDVHLDISVYTDNPFLPASMIEEIEGLKYVDKDLYAIYTKGIWTSLKGLIYPEVTIVDSVPLVGRVYFGMDFGFNDPNVLVRVTLNKNNLYIETLIYKTGMLIDEMAKEMKEHIRPSDPVYCDAAEPRTIAELIRRGIRAKAALKGRDSVRQGLTFIKQHHIFVTADSVDTLTEFKRYKWDTDNQDRLIDKPIGLYGHSSDAVRYAISRALNSRVRLL